VGFALLGDGQGKAHIAFECTHGPAAKGFDGSKRTEKRRRPSGYRCGIMGLAILAAFVLATLPYFVVRGRLPGPGRIWHSINVKRKRTQHAETDAHSTWHEQHSWLYDKVLEVSWPGLEIQ
jgi:hypothetical protein